MTALLFSPDVQRSYEVLLWLVRTAAGVSAARDPAADQPGPHAGQARPGLRLVPPDGWSEGWMAGSPNRAAGQAGPPGQAGPRAAARSLA